MFDNIAVVYDKVNKWTASSTMGLAGIQEVIEGRFQVLSPIFNFHGNLRGNIVVFIVSQATRRFLWFHVFFVAMSSATFIP